jgi:hypothetical protein
MFALLPNFQFCPLLFNFSQTIKLVFLKKIKNQPNVKTFFWDCDSLTKYNIKQIIWFNYQSTQHKKDEIKEKDWWSELKKKIKDQNNY